MITVLSPLFMTACQTNQTMVSAANPMDGAPGLDYADRKSWAALPEFPGRHDIDVLWFYPVAVDRENVSAGFTDPKLRKAALANVIRQAGTFAKSSDLYAPFCRRPNRNATSQNDLWRALKYYLKHYNNRPFVLAARGRGSGDLLAMLKKHWGATGKEHLLVAAYLIGGSITGDDIAANPKIKVCAGPADTNCFIAPDSAMEGMKLGADLEKRIEVFTLERLRGIKLGIPTKLPPFDPVKDVPEAPDYANPDSWIARPDFYSKKQQPVDVFWIYPTILSDGKTYLMDTAKPELRERAQWTLVEQASIFDGQANLYAPYYRQNNVKINPVMLTHGKPVFNLGQRDLIRAFDYFVKNINKGQRPIILAAHSQGSVRMVELSKSGGLLTGGKESLANLVAAYTIGYSITPEDLRINPLMKICRSADETGCFIAYNTISAEPGKEKQGPTIIPGTFVVNPLTWTTGDTPGTAADNIGAAFFRHEDPSRPVRYPHFCAAQKKGNALVVTDVSNPKELRATSVTFPPGVYHMYDYAIFYENLKHNVGARIAAYFKQSK